MADVSVSKKIKLSSIKPNPQNPRIIKDDKFRKLVQSIKDFPEMAEVREIVINKDNVILGGNMRYKAMLEAGWKEAPVRVVDWSPEKQREFVIKDNVSGGEWDWDLLANDYDKQELEDWGMDVDKDWVTEEPVEDEAPEVSQEPAVSVLGEVYSLGRHRVMCGDSVKIEDVEKLMDGNKAELLFTSPPYSDMREYEGGKDLSVGNLIKFIPTYRPFCEYQVINLGIQRKEQEIVEYWNDYIKLAKNSGYKFLAWNVWNKTTVSIGQQKAFIPIYHEWIFVFGNGFKEINRTEQRKTPIRKENGTTRRQADGSVKFSSIGKQENLKSIDSVFTSNSELGEIRKDHPATFPVELPTKYIKAITNVENNVIDPFLGSGSTLIACEQTNRTCYGMELDPRYVDVIRRRYWKFVNNGDETGWETNTPVVIS